MGGVVEPRQADFTVTANADNAAATATRAAVTDRQHFVTGISGCFSAAVAGARLELREGATVLQDFAVHNQFSEDFAHPIAIARGAACSAVLAASGTGGTVGRVNLRGYSK